MVNDLRCKKEQTLYEALKNASIKYPNNPSFYYIYKKFSYTHLIKRINQFAFAMKEMGIKEDDVVTICLPNIPDALYIFYAINQLGAIANCVHPLFTYEQMEENMLHTKSKILYCLSTTYQMFYKLNDKGIKVISCSPTQEMSFVLDKAYKFKFRKQIGKIDNINSTYFYYKSGLLNTFDKDYLKDSIYLHSGGTSGNAKTIALSSFSMNALASNGQEILDLKDFNNAHMLAVLPMFHGFGLCMGVHAMLAHGGCDILMPKFSSKETIKYLSKGKINYLIGIPTLYEALLKQPTFSGKKLQNLNIAFAGGDFVSTSLIERFNNRMKEAGSICRLREGYGLTETVTVCCVNTHKHHKQGTVGRPLENIQFKIVDVDTLKELPKNSEGELLVSGETLMNGYRFCDDNVNKEVFILDENNKKWVRTGDYCILDEDNYLIFKQRLKRIVKVSGIPVFPSMIENMSASFDFVHEVAAVGVPDSKLGNIIKLYVSLNKNIDISHEEVKNILIKEIANKCGIYSKPKEVIILDSLPHTVVGKVDVKKLN